MITFSYEPHIAHIKLSLARTNSVMCLEAPHNQNMLCCLLLLPLLAEADCFAACCCLPLFLAAAGLKLGVNEKKKESSTSVQGDGISRFTSVREMTMFQYCLIYLLLLLTVSD